MTSSFRRSPCAMHSTVLKVRTGPLRSAQNRPHRFETSRTYPLCHYSMAQIACNTHDSQAWRDMLLCRLYVSPHIPHVTTFIKLSLSSDLFFGIAVGLRVGRSPGPTGYNDDHLSIEHLLTPSDPLQCPSSSPAHNSVPNPAPTSPAPTKVQNGVV